MPQVFLEEKTSLKLQEPRMAKVLMLNDDYTAMDFVVEILMEIFEKSNQEALKIMLDVHNAGSGVCGIYPYDIAELKVQLAKDRSREKGYPLNFEIIYEAKD